MSLSNFISNSDGVLQVKEIRILSLGKSVSTEINDLETHIKIIDEKLKELSDKLDRVIAIDEEKKVVIIPPDCTVFVRGAINIGDD